MFKNYLLIAWRNLLKNKIYSIINVLGLASISQDVTPELARATIASISVLGALHASPAVKAALSDRTR